MVAKVFGVAPSKSIASRKGSPNSFLAHRESDRSDVEVQKIGFSLLRETKQWGFGTEGLQIMGYPYPTATGLKPAWLPKAQGDIKTI